LPNDLTTFIILISQDQIQFLTPSQLSQVGKSNSSYAFSIAQSLASSGVKLSPIMALSLGANILPNATTNMSCNNFVHL
jgi:hypothetical protein